MSIALCAVIRAAVESISSPGRFSELLVSSFQFALLQTTCIPPDICFSSLQNPKAILVLHLRVSRSLSSSHAVYDFIFNPEFGGTERVIDASWNFQKGNTQQDQLLIQLLLLPSLVQVHECSVYWIITAHKLSFSAAGILQITAELHLDLTDHNRLFVCLFVLLS